MIRVTIDTDDDFHVRIKGTTITGSSELTFMSKSDFQEAAKKAKITYHKPTKKLHAEEFLHSLQVGVTSCVGNYTLEGTELTDDFYVLKYDHDWGLRGERRISHFLLNERFSKTRTISFLKERLQRPSINENAFSYKKVKLGERF